MSSCVAGQQKGRGGLTPRELKAIGTYLCRVRNKGQQQQQRRAHVEAGQQAGEKQHFHDHGHQQQQQQRQGHPGVQRSSGPTAHSRTAAVPSTHPHQAHSQSLLQQHWQPVTTPQQWSKGSSRDRRARATGLDMGVPCSGSVGWQQPPKAPEVHAAQPCWAADPYVRGMQLAHAGIDVDGVAHWQVGFKGSRKEIRLRKSKLLHSERHAQAWVSVSQQMRGEG